ncbi:hypothetical protein EDB87DRAFT_1553269, partial [Lactarius vividus]
VPADDTTATPSFPRIVLESLLAVIFGITDARLQASALKDITWVCEMKTRCAKHKVTSLA